MADIAVRLIGDKVLVRGTGNQLAAAISDKCCCGEAGAYALLICINVSACSSSDKTWTEDDFPPSLRAVGPGGGFNQILSRRMVYGSKLSAVYRAVVCSGKDDFPSLLTIKGVSKREITVGVSKLEKTSIGCPQYDSPTCVAPEGMFSHEAVSGFFLPCSGYRSSLALLFVSPCEFGKDFTRYPTSIYATIGSSRYAFHTSAALSDVTSGQMVYYLSRCQYTDDADNEPFPDEWHGEIPVEITTGDWHESITIFVTGRGKLFDSCDPVPKMGYYSKFSYIGSGSYNARCKGYFSLDMSFYLTTCCTTEGYGSFPASFLARSNTEQDVVLYREYVEKDEENGLFVAKYSARVCVEWSDAYSNNYPFFNGATGFNLLAFDINASVDQPFGHPKIQKTCDYSNPTHVVNFGTRNVECRWFDIEIQRCNIFVPEELTIDVDVYGHCICKTYFEYEDGEYKLKTISPISTDSNDESYVETYRFKVGKCDEKAVFSLPYLDSSCKLPCDDVKAYVKRDDSNDSAEEGELVPVPSSCEQFAEVAGRTKTKVFIEKLVDDVPLYLMLERSYVDCCSWASTHDAFDSVEVSLDGESMVARRLRTRETATGYVDLFTVPAFFDGVCSGVGGTLLVQLPWYGDPLPAAIQASSRCEALDPWWGNALPLVYASCDVGCPEGCSIDYTFCLADGMCSAVVDLGSIDVEDFSKHAKEMLPQGASVANASAEISNNCLRLSVEYCSNVEECRELASEEFEFTYGDFRFTNTTSGGTVDRMVDLDINIAINPKECFEGEYYLPPEVYVNIDGEYHRLTVSEDSITGRIPGVGYCSSFISEHQQLDFYVNKDGHYESAYMLFSEIYAVFSKGEPGVLVYEGKANPLYMYANISMYLDTSYVESPRCVDWHPVEVGYQYDFGEYMTSSLYPSSGISIRALSYNVNFNPCPSSETIMQIISDAVSYYEHTDDRPYDVSIYAPDGSSNVYLTDGGLHMTLYATCNKELFVIVTVVFGNASVADPKDFTIDGRELKGAFPIGEPVEEPVFMNDCSEEFRYYVDGEVTSTWPASFDHDTVIQLEWKSDVAVTVRAECTDVLGLLGPNEIPDLTGYIGYDASDKSNPITLSKVMAEGDSGSPVFTAEWQYSGTQWINSSDSRWYIDGSENAITSSVPGLSGNFLSVSGSFGNPVDPCVLTGYGTIKYSRALVRVHTACETNCWFCDYRDTLGYDIPSITITCEGDSKVVEDACVESDLTLIGPSPDVSSGLTITGTSGPSSNVTARIESVSVQSDGCNWDAQVNIGLERKWG